jgi:hypothetical protein
VYFCFDLCWAVDELSSGKDALEDLGYAVSDGVTCTHLVV